MITILKGNIIVSKEKDMTLISMTEAQLLFVIEQSKLNLEFSDYFNSYGVGGDKTTSTDTKYLEEMVTLLHQCVTKKENEYD